MPKVLLICKYCDLRWKDTIYSAQELGRMKCVRCNDRHLTAKDISEVQIDTYVGCPPFPKDNEDETVEDIYSLSMD